MNITAFIITFIMGYIVFSQYQEQVAKYEEKKKLKKEYDNK